MIIKEDDNCNAEYYISGHCAAYAIALHRVFKWPIYGLFHYGYHDVIVSGILGQGEVKVEKRLLKTTDHAFCMIPGNENNIIDASGIQPINQLLHRFAERQYKESDIQTTTESELFKIGWALSDSQLTKDENVENAIKCINKNMNNIKKGLNQGNR